MNINILILQCLAVMIPLMLLLLIKLTNNKKMNILIYSILSLITIYAVACGLYYIWKIPITYYLLIPYVIFLFISYIVYNYDGNVKPKKKKETFVLRTESMDIEYYYPRDNFIVYGGAGSGKTASIGKPLMEEYIKNGWAGFIYDYKDFDYTKTAYALCEKYKYPYSFYYVSFTDMKRTYRFNVFDKRVISSESLLFQVIDDFLKSMLPVDGKTDEWYNGALGILKGVAIRFYSFHPDSKYSKYFTLPHILNFILLCDSMQLIRFLEGDLMAKRVAGAFIGARSSERTRDSYLSTLNNYITNIATNKKVCYVLTGDDFVYNLVDPEEPKLFAISNNFALESLISPIVAMLLPIAARKIEFGNKIKFAFILDEMTTFKVNNFQNMPSVLREYGASFLIMTQSGAKLEKVYGKHDRASIEANCANIFLGRTKDVEALKYYPTFFGKEEKDKKSQTSGSSNSGYNSSVTTSQQKEEVYDSNKFAEQQQGQFIISCGEANIKRGQVKFKMFKIEEEELPIIHEEADGNEIDEIYEQIGNDCQYIIDTLIGS